MKVLFITNLPAPYRVKFFEEFGKLCDLTVLYERKSASDRDDKWIASHNDTYREIFLNGKEIGADNSFSLGAIKYIKDRNYDRIIVGMYSTYSAIAAITYMKTHRISFWISTDGGFVKKESKNKLKLKRFLIGSANGWLTTGANATEYLVHYGAIKERCYMYPFTSVKKNEILSKPVNQQEKNFYKEKLKMIEDKIVLSVGQFIHRKGYDVLLKACKNIDRSIGFYIVGGKPTKEYLFLQEKYHLSNVHFIDFITKDRLTEYYMASDLFVLPTREDVWALVINEAMAYGLPVITTSRCMAGVELISEDNIGRIIEDFENPIAWKEIIEKSIEQIESFEHRKIKNI